MHIYDVELKSQKYVIFKHISNKSGRRYVISRNYGIELSVTSDIVMNFEREYGGLFEAMKFFNVKNGVIVTFNQQDIFEKDGYTIHLTPAYKYLSK